MAEITREWLEAELALCAEKGAGGKYLALLQWAVEALRRIEGWEHDALIYAQNAAFHEERERRLREALAECCEAFRLTHEYLGEKRLPALAGWSWFDADNRAKALLEELKEVPYA